MSHYTKPGVGDITTNKCLIRKGERWIARGKEWKSYRKTWCCCVIMAVVPVCTFWAAWQKMGENGRLQSRKHNNSRLRFDLDRIPNLLQDFDQTSTDHISDRRQLSRSPSSFGYLVDHCHMLFEVWGSAAPWTAATNRNRFIINWGSFILIWLNGDDR